MQAHFFVNPACSELWLWGQQLAVVTMLCVRYAFKSALPTWSFTRAALPEWTAAPEWSFAAPECDRYTAIIGLLAALAMLLGSRPDPQPQPAVGVARWGLAALAFATNMFMTFWLYTCHKYARAVKPCSCPRHYNASMRSLQCCAAVGRR